jgi:hypothetical protein
MLGDFLFAIIFFYKSQRSTLQAVMIVWSSNTGNVLQLQEGGDFPASLHHAGKGNENYLQALNPARAGHNLIRPCEEASFK